MKKNVRSRTLRAAASSVLALFVGHVHAQSWNGAGADDNWSTGANWVGNVPPASSNATAVTFSAASARFSPIVDAPWTINRLDLTSATGYAFTGNTITFDGVSPQLNFAAGTHTFTNDLLFVADTAVVTSVDQVMNNVVGGTAGMIKAGPARLTLGNFLLYGGNTVVLAGTLQIGTGGGGPNTFVSPIIVGSTIEFVMPGATVNANSISGPGNVTVTAGSVQVSGGMGQGGTTTVGAGVGTATLSGDFIGAGPLVIGTSGTVQTGNSTVAALSGVGNLFSNATAVTVGTDNTSTTFSGPVAGTGGLTKVGSGRLILTNFLSPGGGFSAQGGVLQFGDGISGPNFFAQPIVDNATIEFAGSGPTVNLSGVTGSGAVIISGGGLITTGAGFTQLGSTTLLNNANVTAFIDSPGALTVTSPAVLNTGDSFVGSLAGSGQVILTGTAITAGSDNTSTTFQGALGGGGGLTKVGAGTLTLANFLMYGGVTTVNGGTLQIGNGIAGPNVISSPIIDNALLVFGGSGSTVQIQGISGTGSVNITAGSVLDNGAGLTQAGPTTITVGTFTGAIFNNKLVTLGPGGVFTTGGSLIGSLAGSGTFNNNGITQVGNDNTSTTFSGAINGPGQINKVGVGTLTLSGASLSTGPKNVFSGTLIVTGSIPGPVTVSGGATLGGTGTIAGPVSVGIGGTISPGLSPGVINTGDITLSGATLMEIQGNVLGTQYDNINVTGTVTINGSGTLSLTGGYVPVAGDVFTLVTNDAADAVTGTFFGLPEGATVTFNGVPLRISYIGGTGNDITLTAVSTTTVTWNGAGANNNWSTGANWVSGVAPASGNTTFVTFPTASARFAPNVDAPWIVNRIDITGTTPYVISGAPLNFAGTTTAPLNTSGAAHAIGNPILLTATLAVANATQLTLAGPISGTSAITKTGAGTLVLPGITANSSGVIVNGGTLLVTGTVSGTVTVNPGGTLGGTGTVGPVLMSGGSATISPGLSPGVLNTGNLQVAGIALMEIQGTALGTQYDNINVTGTVTINGATLTLTGAYVPNPGDVFTIITNDGADAVAGFFGGLPQGSTITFNGIPLQVSYTGGTGNDVTLTALAAIVVPAQVPTLSEWAMALLALVLLGLGMQRARRAR